MSIQIVKPTPGLTTTEKILELILAHPQGITVKEICCSLNRPVSMVQICLKRLQSSRQVYAKKHQSCLHLVYYPRSTEFLNPNQNSKEQKKGER
ncbi:winged helix-turn-helix domain-containing protein [Pleurocapsales cyanobacterium LEGE 06147]|nr:winged helix-turn-helix domain-containing protein [Pleurocapsales cyanobacterium LEGE 06147]